MWRIIAFTVNIWHMLKLSLDDQNNELYGLFIPVLDLGKHVIPSAFVWGKNDGHGGESPTTFD